MKSRILSFGRHFRRRCAAWERGRRTRVHLAAVEPLEQRLLLASPLPTLSTYFGGSGNEYVADMAVDSQGNTYVIGTTTSPNLPGVDGGSGANTGTDRAFLARFNSGGELDFARLLGPDPRFDAGGFASSQGHAVEIGANDVPFIVFETQQGDVLSLQAGGLLPLLKEPQFVLSDLNLSTFALENPVALGVLDISSSSLPYGFTAVLLALGPDNSAYVAYTALRGGGGAALDGGFSECAGRNTSERRASLEKENAGADPILRWGRPPP